MGLGATATAWFAGQEGFDGTSLGGCGLPGLQCLVEGQDSSAKNDLTLWVVFNMTAGGGFTLNMQVRRQRVHAGGPCIALQSVL